MCCSLWSRRSVSSSRFFIIIVIIIIINIFSRWWCGGGSGGRCSCGCGCGRCWWCGSSSSLWTPPSLLLRPKSWACSEILNKWESLSSQKSLWMVETFQDWLAQLVFEICGDTLNRFEDWPTPLSVKHTLNSYNT